MNIIFISLFTLLCVGALSAIILFFTSTKFRVYENPLIDEVLKVLPGVNCGGCGHPSCRGFAVACINAESLNNMVCTVGRRPTMELVATIVGKRARSIVPTLAVVKCGGECDFRPRTNHYDGVSSCAIVHNLYGGATGCSWGCLGLGDCEVACKFDALHINKITQLPEINEEKCVSCNACVKACPKLIIELRKNKHKSRRIYVNCSNKHKGEGIIKSCAVACTGCEKCVEECAYDAISIANNLAYINSEKCTLCRRCVDVCPTSAIVELNFPLRKTKKETMEKVVEPII